MPPIPKPPLKVLSLFDGMGNGRYLAKLLGRDVDYIASEIDPNAIKLHQYNFPKTKQVGDVTKYKLTEPVDIVIGGSPCQSFSSLGKRDFMRDYDTGDFIKSLTDYELATGAGHRVSPSSLFWEYARLLRDAKKLNPDVKFFWENVASIPPEWQKIISDELGAPLFKSAGLGASARPRLYATNAMTPMEYTMATHGRTPQMVYLDPNLYREPTKRSIRVKSPKNWSQLEMDLGLPVDNNIFVFNGGFAKDAAGKGGAYVSRRHGRVPTLPARGHAVYLDPMDNIYKELTKQDYLNLQGLGDYKVPADMTSSQLRHAVGNAWDINDVKPIFERLYK